MVLNGTAAIRIAASPLSIWVSPQPIMTKGSMVPKAPMISSGHQWRRSRHRLLSAADGDGGQDGAHR